MMVEHTWHSGLLTNLGFNAEAILRRLRHIYFLGAIRTGSCKMNCKNASVNVSRNINSGYYIYPVHKATSTTTYI